MLFMVLQFDRIKPLSILAEQAELLLAFMIQTFHCYLLLIGAHIML
jgi:hypothetical protein